MDHRQSASNRWTANRRLPTVGPHETVAVASHGGHDGPGGDPDPRDWLAAIIEGSDDAIISKDLDGNIRSWNPGATRLFGYKADEVIGQSIMILIPPDRLDEEPAILAEIRRGNRVDHFETVRMRKDGSLIDISLTISPVHNQQGEIVGASKIARDITEYRLAQERQQLLMGEMHHRIKNLFALTGGIVSMSARAEANGDEIVQAIQARLLALSRAHNLIMPSLQGDQWEQPSTDLLTLLGTILQPYERPGRIAIEGANPPVGGSVLTNIALLMHELATNAAKYGCLSVPEGHLRVSVTETAEEISLLWTETGGPVPPTAIKTGFGSRLEQGLAAALHAAVERDWKTTGLVITLRLPSSSLVP